MNFPPIPTASSPSPTPGDRQSSVPGVLDSDRWQADDLSRSDRAELIDHDLTMLWNAACESVSIKPREGAALAAVGSHGRRDAGPRSDLDLVLIHDGRTHSEEQIARLAQALWYPLWDTGIDIDHSVRTLSQCRRIASEDFVAAVGLISVRGICGDPEVVSRAQQAVLKDWREAARRRLPQLVASLERRAIQFGELAFSLEPELKECRGGIRDVTVLDALAATWLTDRPHGDVDAAHQHLLDVRDALAVVSRRRSPKLLMSMQPEVAARLGMAGLSVIGQDALLSSLAEAGRTISYSLDTTVRRARRELNRPPSGRRPILVRGRRRPPRLKAVSAELVELDGELVLGAGVDVSQDPQLPLNVIAAAARSSLALSPVTVQSLTAAAPLPTPWTAPQLAQFEVLLRSGHARAGLWEAMDRCGLLVTWIPEWAAVRNRPQRNPIHRFTVDRHMVETVMNAAELVDESTQDPAVLLWAALLHDIGKLPGVVDHRIAGYRIARDILHRIGVPGAEDIAMLVRHHLLLPQIATSKDVNDPQTLAFVAGQLGHRTDLVTMLGMLTEADARAAGPAAWTKWRAKLVQSLVANVGEFLNRG